MPQDITLKTKSRQTWIFDRLVTNPSTTFSEIFQLYKSEFGLSQKTFSKDWRAACNDFAVYQDRYNKAKVDANLENDLSESKKLLLDKFKRMQIAESIALGTIEGVEATIKERLQALDYLSKIEGDYSASKIETTGIITRTIKVSYSNDDDD